MTTINYGRVFLGGLVAAAVIFILEGISAAFYGPLMEAEMQELGLTADMTAAAMVQMVLVCLLIGIVSIFFYAAVRPRLGPGPGTAACVATALFFGGYVPNLLGYNMLGIFPPSLLLLWGIVGLVELVLATLAGAWVYRE